MSHVPRVVLVTGGFGFIGTNYVRWLLERDPEVRVVNLDALTYAGNTDNLADLPRRLAARHTPVHADIRDAAAVAEVFAAHAPDTVVHFAAESHVDRSIEGPTAFLDTHIMGTAVLLQAARQAWVGRDDVRLHHVSTDEVFGSLGSEGFFVETTPYDPSSPYSASKAAADHLVMAWHRTYGLPITLSNCSNNYGPYQFPEKLIPVMITKALAFEQLPVYGDGQNVRDWLYVADHCAAIDTILRRAPTGSSWLVGGDNEWKNLDLVRLLCDRIDLVVPSDRGPRRELITFVTDRPGHDRRYAIDAGKLERELGWVPSLTFEQGIDRTIEWTLAHREWTARILSGDYRLERLGLVS